jgi:hypothetical protein
MKVRLNLTLEEALLFERLLKHGAFGINAENELRLYRGLEQKLQSALANRSNGP